jgi:hypothetical protein
MTAAVGSILFSAPSVLRGRLVARRVMPEACQQKAAPANCRPAHAPFLPDARVPRVSDSKSEGAGRPTPGSGVVGQSMLARTPRAVSGFRFAAPASDPTGLDGRSPLRGLPNTTPGSHQSRRRSSWRPSLSRGRRIVSRAEHAGIGAGWDLAPMVNARRGRSLRNVAVQANAVLPGRKKQKLMPG